MKNNDLLVYGIDVSKDQLDICLINQGERTFVQICNRKAAILTWIEELDKERSYCVLEYTGSYSSQLLNLLSSQGIALSAVNPSQSSHFVKALGIVNKNDKNAAEALALMGSSLDLPL